MTITKYNILDFYPDCCLPDCPDYVSGKQHQHILPHQQDINNSTADYLYIQGGVGSAKSLACAAKVVRLSLEISNNVGIVSRRDYKLMYKSSWLDVKQCIRRLVSRNVINQPKYSDKRQGDYTTITFDNGSILYAMQGKNWSEGLGASYGLFWIDDAFESYEEMFIGDETSAGLLSRLRLPHVHYYRDASGIISNKLHGIVSSNPPPIGHWLHKLFGNKAGMHKIGDQTVEWIQVATHQNPFVGADYAKGLIAIQSQMGRNTNTVRRVIFGESIPAYGGIPVYPEFNESKHVADIIYKKDLPIVCGWDFGFHHPAVTFSNLYKCSKGTNHYLTLSEVADHFGINIWDFYDRAVKPHIDTLYKDCCLILNGGDRAGYRSSSSNKDNRGDMRILMVDYKLPFKWRRHLDLANSLQYMRGLLKNKCECGLEKILISNQCKVLIGALQGGYKFPKPRSGPVGDKPVEDRYFADVACGWRYGAENFVKWGIPYEDRSALKQRPAMPLQGQGQTPWAWMNMSDTEMAALLV